MTVFNITNLNIEQLNELKDRVLKAITAKKAEDSRIVWQVLNGHITLGCFRDNEYEKAMECLMQAASKAYAFDKEAVANLQFSIEALRVPVSEYDGWIKHSPYRA